MCWITYDKLEKKIAEKNIECFKVVKDDLKSFYYGFQYKIGETVIESKPINPRRSPIYNRILCIEDGLHSYLSKECYPCIIDKSTIAIRSHSEGFVTTYHRKCKIIDCIIPKSSVYYINSGGEIVSNCIKVIGVRKNL